ncbi:hypothetical protein C8R44DRAFT_740416 [Mycena epipterygia]|nr:hypothetical protein C8R44DRAFT_740416 [Mycena epipterygia]
MVGIINVQPGINSFSASQSAAVKPTGLPGQEQNGFIGVSPSAEPLVPSACTGNVMGTSTSWGPSGSSTRSPGLWWREGSRDIRDKPSWCREDCQLVSMLCRLGVSSAVAYLAKSGWSARRLIETTAKSAGSSARCGGLGEHSYSQKGEADKRGTSQDCAWIEHEGWNEPKRASIHLHPGPWERVPNDVDQLARVGTGLLSSKHGLCLSSMRALTKPIC